MDDTSEGDGWSREGEKSGNGSVDGLLVQGGGVEWMKPC